MLRVGILNNMPEAAVRSTERQFRDLFTAAARPVELRWFSFWPRQAYEPVEALWALQSLDGLIVTGTEPVAPLLHHEACWPLLVRTIEWAAACTVSAIWSCLAAHGAVYHLTGVERRPLPRKLFGLFQVARVAQHPLLAGIPSAWCVPHSRLNDLPCERLAAHEFTVLSHSPETGADIGACQCGNSLFLMMQGHPEYDGRALMREYRRDVLRFLTGERPQHPELPIGYFDSITEASLRDLRREAEAHRSPDVMVEIQNLVGQSDLSGPWRSTAALLYRNWLDLMGARITARTAETVP